MIFALIKIDKTTNAVLQMFYAADANDFLKVCTVSEHYEHIRHLLSIPGFLTNESQIILDETEEHKVCFFAVPAIIWTASEPGTINLFLKEHLEELKCPERFRHYLN